MARFTFCGGWYIIEIVFYNELQQVRRRRHSRGVRMKYQINQNNYHTFSIYEINKLPARSYFIPYPDRAKADGVAPKEKRYASEKVVCLNGEWDFKFYKRPAEVPMMLDTEKVNFDKIDVPACWQFRGYDKPFYINIRYQFPFKPPVIPTIEKVGRVFSWIGVDQQGSG